MSGTARQDLVTMLRTRLSDSRPTVAAFSIAIGGDPGASAGSALLEITNGFLSVSVDQGRGVQSLRWDLNDPRYSTVGRLISALTRMSGYAIVPEVSYSTDHPSIDLHVEGMPDIKKNPHTLRHRLFSDEELIAVLETAMATHNPSYSSLSGVPKVEYQYVLLKAQATAYRIMATDSAKRRGLDVDADVYVKMAADLEEQYRHDRKLQERTIPLAKTDDSGLGSGNAVQGTFYRRSLRAGYDAPYRAAQPLVPPDLFDCADDDVEDVDVRLRWSQNREQKFSYYELWRDTVPVVDRSITGRLTNFLYNNNNQRAQLPVSTQYSRFSSSRQVLGVSAGGNRVAPIFDGFFFWTAAELSGTSLVQATFIDGIIFNNPGTGPIDLLGEPLEPDTDYYYRLYAIDWNGEVVPSRVLKVHTKKMRARFLRLISGNAANAVLSPNAITPQQGSLSVPVTMAITGTNFPATGLVVTVGGFPCTSVVVNNTVTPNVLTCTTPQLVNGDFAGTFTDVVLRSPSGMYDMASNAWKWLA